MGSSIQSFISAVYWGLLSARDWLLSQVAGLYYNSFDHDFIAIVLRLAVLEDKKNVCFSNLQEVFNSESSMNWVN